MERALPDHHSAAQRAGHRTARGADGLATPGDQRPGGAAVLGRLAVGVPWRHLPGAGVPLVEGQAAGDPTAVRAAGRPGAGLEGTPGKKARHDSRSWFRAIRSLSDWLRSDEDIVLG